MAAPPEPAIRDAATIVVVRQAAAGPAVLMGQRGRGAVFMPDKFVFPGGALDAADRWEEGDPPLAPRCLARLGDRGPALAAAALRELAEETGLRLEGGRAGLRFFFRAITPPGRTRRFDARFFLADAAAVAGDLDDFSAADQELSHLAWVPLAEARRLDLPFITEVVLAEIAPSLADPSRPVPFFHQEDGRGVVTALS